MNNKSRSDAAPQQDVIMQDIPANVYRSEGRVMVSAPMPGLEPQDISVTVQDGPQVIIEGQLRGALKDDKEIIQDEWTPGPYHCEVDLPEHVDGNRANVTYNNGVLVVVLPAAGETVTAQLNLERKSATQGARIGNAGQNNEPPGNERGPSAGSTAFNSGETL